MWDCLKFTYEALNRIVLNRAMQSQNNACHRQTVMCEQKREQNMTNLFFILFSLCIVNDYNLLIPTNSHIIPIYYISIIYVGTKRL